MIRGIALVVLLATAPSAAHALPLFTHDTGLGCADCHDPVPRLNATGLAFLARGYRMMAGHQVSAGRARPFSVIASLGYGVIQHDTLGTDPDGRDTTRPRRPHESELELHAAGASRDHWSWHVDQRVGTASGTLETSTAWGQLDATERGGVQIRAGRFEAGLPFLAASRRVQLAPYLTPVSIDVRGVELNGSRDAWTYAAGLAENHRSLPGGGRSLRVLTHMQDSYAWVAREFAGQRVGARVWFDRQDSNLPFHTWLQHMQHEVAACFTAGAVQVVPAYVLDRYDDRPAAELHDKHHMALLEFTAPLERARHWWLSGRIEHEYRTLTPFSRELDRQLAALDLAYDPRPDARVALEWTHGADNVGDPRVDGLDAYMRIGF